MARRRTGRKRGIRRKRAAPWKLRGLTGLTIILLFAVASGVAFFRGGPNSLANTLNQTQALVTTLTGPAPEPLDRTIAQVERVVDGDTILVRFGGGSERVRLLRIDTPESVHSDASRNHPLGRDASDFLKGLLENRQVRLETQPDRERDRFGRMLAYVFVDGVNINVEIVRAGWSPYMTQWGRSTNYEADFQRAEQEARRALRGIWADQAYLRSAGIQ